MAERKCLIEEENLVSATKCIYKLCSETEKKDGKFIPIVNQAAKQDISAHWAIQNETSSGIKPRK